jgi:hypothetical protein
VGVSWYTTWVGVDVGAGVSVSVDEVASISVGVGVAVASSSFPVDGNVFSMLIDCVDVGFPPVLSSLMPPAGFPPEGEIEL